MKKIALVVLGMVLGAAISVGAANKLVTSTLVPPTSLTSGGYSICITNSAALGGTADTLIGVTRACAYDAVTKQQECKDNVESTQTPDANMITFINARLTAWRAANGY